MAARKILFYRYLHTFPSSTSIVLDLISRCQAKTALKINESANSVKYNSNNNNGSK